MPVLPPSSDDPVSRGSGYDLFEAAGVGYSGGKQNERKRRTMTLTANNSASTPAPGATAKQGYNLFLLVVAGLGGLLYGMDIGIIGGALPYLAATSHLTRRGAFGRWWQQCCWALSYPRSLPESLPTGWGVNR